MKNLLTVDLEDWFSVETFQAVYTPSQWDGLESVVRGTTEKILKLFFRHGTRATFFVLGWVADRYPGLVYDIVSVGHEIACHSFYHRMVSSLTPAEFEQDTRMAVAAIRRASGVIPIGYRSPSWGMKHTMTWAYDILADLGFEYDSSVFPIHHDIYGDPESPRKAFEVKTSSGKRIIEIPASTIVVLGRQMPLGGGGWLRQLPYWFTRRGIEKLNQENIPAMIYFHPWELERNLPGSRFAPDVIKSADSFKTWIRQYKNLVTMEIKVEKLLEDFEFIPLREYLATFNLKEGSTTG
jgi:polysaccharide deacetylase family protein (PEP-CTERM system associated)